MGLTKLVIRGARQHNLKNISVEIPRNSLTVITGLSGSGKSSLAFGIDGVKGERGFARAGKAGDDREGVPGNFDADVLEVVLARSPNDDFLQAHIAKTAPTAGPAHCG